MYCPGFHWAGFVRLVSLTAQFEAAGTAQHGDAGAESICRKSLRPGISEANLMARMEAESPARARPVVVPCRHVHE